LRLTLITFEFYLPVSHSLKDKRRVIQGLKTRIRNRLNVSVAEVEYQESWQRSVLAVAWVSSDGSSIDKTISILDKLIVNQDEVQVVKAVRSDY